MEQHVKKAYSRKGTLQKKATVGLMTGDEDGEVAMGKIRKGQGGHEENSGFYPE